jgi:hypothetical protein
MLTITLAALLHHRHVSVMIGKGTPMATITLIALLLLAPLAYAGDTTCCITREDPELRRWITECTDGSRSVSRWDAGLQRWQTDVTKPPQANQPPRGGPTPGKPPR